MGSVQYHFISKFSGMSFGVHWLLVVDWGGSLGFVVML